METCIQSYCRVKQLRLHTKSKSVLIAAGNRINSRLTPTLRHKPVTLGAGDYIAYPHDTATFLLMRSMRIPCPHPVTTQFDWPGPYTPMRHQIAMTAHIVSKKRTFTWGDIGVGKTASAIWADSYLRSKRQVKRTMVVAPLSTLQSTWRNEYFKLCTRTNVGVVTGGRQKKIATIQAKPDVLVINHDALRHLEDYLFEYDADFFIVDEHTKLKNWTAERTKAFRRIIDGNDVWMTMMSGEPMPQSPMDLHAPSKLVCKSAVPNSKRSWQNKTMIQRGPYKWIPKPDVEKLIAGMIDDYVIRINRDDCLDLPSTQYDTAQCEPSPELIKIQKQLEAQAVADIDGGTIVAANEGVHMIKMLQAACGAVRVTDGVRDVKCESKFSALDDILASSRGPVLVYSPYIAPLDALERHIKTKKIDGVAVKYARVDGSTALSKRTDAFRQVQDNEIKVLLANPAAMSHGVTLTASNTVVWWGLPYSNETYGQANGRIIRKGQDRKTYITHLLSLPVERYVLKSLREKRRLQGLLLELVDKPSTMV